MAYLHDVAMSRVLGPSEMTASAGTWTLTTSTQHWFNRRTAADAAFVLRLQAKLPQNSVDLKGAYLKTVDVWYKIATADPTAFTALLYKETLPADTVAFSAPSAQTVTYDADHDTEAERYAQADHKMTMTLSTPIWVDDDANVFVELAVTAHANTVFDFIGARFNYTWRI